MTRLFAMIRIALVVAVFIAAMTVSYQAVHTWQLAFASDPNASENLHFYGFTSRWTFFFPSLLIAVSLALSSVAFLRDRQSRNTMRLLYEVACSALAFYILYILWKTIYLAYNPYHSGPFL